MVMDVGVGILKDDDHGNDASIQLGDKRGRGLLLA